MAILELFLIALNVDTTCLSNDLTSQIATLTLDTKRPILKEARVEKMFLLL